MKDRDSINQDRINEALMLLEASALAEGDGREFHNPERRFICRYFLLHSHGPSTQDLWDAYTSE